MYFGFGLFLRFSPSLGMMCLFSFVWCSLNFLVVWFGIFYLIWEIFNYYLFMYFFWPVLFFFSHVILLTCMLDHKILSHGSCMIFFWVFLSSPTLFSPDTTYLLGSFSWWCWCWSCSWKHCYFRRWSWSMEAYTFCHVLGASRLLLK